MLSIHRSHLQLQLLALTLPQLSQPLLLNVHLHPLLLLIFDLENVVLVILTTRSSPENFALRRCLLGFAYFWKNEGFPMLLLGVVNRIDHLLRVHTL
jgi:hypothetical protein